MPHTRRSYLKPDYIVLAGLAAVAFAHWGTNTFYTQALVMAVVALVALSFMSKDWLVGVMGAFIGAWFIALDFKGITNAQVLLWIIAGMAAYVATRLGEAEKKVYLDGICIIATLLSAFGLIIYQVQGISVATLGNQNFLGAFLAISAFACFRRKRWYWLFLILPALWLCKSSTPIAAFCAGLGFYLWRWKGLALAVIPGAAYFFLVDGGWNIVNGTDRFDFWLDAIEKIGGSWSTMLFGVGPGIYWQIGDALHSEYVYTLWYLGVLGIVLLTLYIVRSFIRGKDRLLSAALIAILVDGIGNHLMHTAPTAMLAVIVFGLKDRELDY